MNRFCSYNPIAQTVYFLCVTLCVMFSVEPRTAAISLVGALAYYFINAKNERAASHLWTFLLMLVMALVNPLFYHNGATVLLVINDNPITLEALLWGVTSALSVGAVLYWFRSFSKIMTGDRLLYVTSKLSPKLSLLLSTTLRYIPLFAAQAGRVREAQRALGKYKDGNIVDTMRGDLGVFSIMTTWALEHGIITADSMEARGYGTRRRTAYALWRLDMHDIAFIVISLVLAAATLTISAFGYTEFTFYPEIIPPRTTFPSIIAYSAYAMLALLPTLNDITERLRWKYLLQKI